MTLFLLGRREKTKQCILILEGIPRNETRKGLLHDVRSKLDKGWSPAVQDRQGQWENHDSASFFSGTPKLAGDRQCNWDKLKKKL